MPLDSLFTQPVNRGADKSRALDRDSGSNGDEPILREYPHDPAQRIANEPIPFERFGSVFARDPDPARGRKAQKSQNYSPRRYLPNVITTLLIFDLFFIGVAQIASTQTTRGWIALSLPVGVLIAAAICTGVNMLFLHALGSYRRETLTNLRISVVRAATAIAFGSAALFAGRHYGAGIVFPASLDTVSIFETCMLTLASAAVSLLAIFVSRIFAWALLSRQVFTRRILVIGSGKRAHYLKDLMEQASHRVVNELLFVPEYVLGGEQSNVANIVFHPGARLTGKQAEALLRDQAIDEIVVAIDEDQPYSLEPLLAYKANGIAVISYNAFIERETDRVDLNRPDLTWLVFSNGFRLSFADICAKRALDIVVSFAALIISTPVLLAAIAAVACERSGTIFFKQQRVTLDGRVFRLYKIRTMREDAERAGPQWCSAKDPRITRVGAILRRFRIDEIPQLLNVLLGDMSLVGPRPEQPMFVEKLSQDVRFYNLRHTVKAGITGWAQINYPYGATTDDAIRKLEYDLYYIKNYSLLRELSIMLQTARVLFWPPRAN